MGSTIVTTHRVCDRCGSPDIAKGGEGRWNHDTQVWEPATQDEEVACATCLASGVDLAAAVSEFALTDAQRAAIYDGAAYTVDPDWRKGSEAAQAAHDVEIAGLMEAAAEQAAKMAAIDREVRQRRLDHETFVPTAERKMLGPPNINMDL